MKKNKDGICIWLTGLPCSGKTTIANHLAATLRASGRTCSVLDGDVIRPIVSPRQGFTRADREEHIFRTGWIAAEIVRHGGIVICPLVSPYRAARDQVRAMISDIFVEIYISTSAEACEARDVKGMWAEARRGLRSAFTGVDDVYEAPTSPELTIRTERATPQDNAMEILHYLIRHKYISQSNFDPRVTSTSESGQLSGVPA